jgi:tetratricopeptide (TPR) repeat protein
VLGTAAVDLGRRSDAEAHAAAAAAAFAAHGDNERAAAAQLLLAQSLRHDGRAAESQAAVERALALVRDAPPSRIKADALVQWSASLMLWTDRFAESAEHARAGLALAEQLGLVPLQVAALNRLGAALSALDGGGLAELERAIELGRGGAAPNEVSGAYMNLGVLLMGSGRLRDIGRLEAEAMAAANRYGVGDSVQLQTSGQTTTNFRRGDWQRAEELIELYRALTPDPLRHRQAWVVSNVAALIALARGDHAAALAYAEEALFLARRVRQRVGRALGTLACVHVERGRQDEAEPLVDELLVLAGQTPNSLRWMGFLDLGWLIHDLGRSERPPVIPFPIWNDPAQAIARGDLVAAADLLAATELVADGAYAGLRAGEQLAALGRHVEARHHLDHALAFHRRVDATAYVERAEAALAVADMT